MHRSASLSLGFTAPLAWPLAHLPALVGGHAGLAASISYSGVRFGFVHFGGLGRWQARQNACVLNLAKIILNNSFNLYRRRKIYKRYFCSVSSAACL